LPTIEEVAARAGVGRSTVSRVLNDAPHVSQQTRTAVRRAIADLGYVPNVAARTLASHRSGSVTLVLTGSERHVIDEGHLVDLIRGILDGLHDMSVSLRLQWARSGAEQESLGGRLAVGECGGALLLPARGDDPLPVLLAARGIPTVLGGQPPPPDRVPLLSTVYLDHLDGARTAVAYLVGTGRRRVAGIHGPQADDAARARLAGYRDAILATPGAGAIDLVEFGDLTTNGGFAAMRRLLRRNPELDGVFVASDPMAAGAVRALRLAGRDVPDDVAVVGFGDSPVAAQTHPPLTTVHLPVVALGERMARLLLGRITAAAMPERPTVLGTRLVHRQSA
jgi:DNA-binding LacI/PurR family transcriptional regulator